MQNARCGIQNPGKKPEDFSAPILGAFKHFTQLDRTGKSA
jgi:hypothetical protein